MTEIDFNNLGADGWLEVIPASPREVVVALLEAGKTEDEIAELWLNRTGPEANAGFGSADRLRTYFSNFRAEMDAFICGDQRYAKERVQAASIWEKQGRNGLVALVAGFIATNVGLSAVALVPCVALLFALIGKIGVQAYCKTQEKA